MQDVTGFIQKLLVFDKDNIPDAKIIKLKKHISENNMDPEEVEKKVLAAKDLCNWTLAILSYHTVNKRVQPKIKKCLEMKR